MAVQGVNVKGFPVLLNKEADRTLTFTLWNVHVV